MDYIQYQRGLIFHSGNCCLVQFNASPNHTYSDMNGYGPYVTTFAWFRGYWLLWTAMLAMGTVLFWVRGKDTAWRNRFQSARAGLVGSNRLIVGGLAIALLTVGSWIFYNTQVQNTYVTSKAYEKIQVAYEQTYKRYKTYPQPRITDVKYDIAVYPEDHPLIVNGNLQLVNRSSFPIDSLFISLPNRLDYTLTIDRSKQVLNDDKHRFQIYKLSPALAPGDSMRMRFTTNVSFGAAS